jgi:hypothetical protein
MKVLNEINGCCDCPYKERVYEHGFMGIVCGHKKCRNGYETVDKYKKFPEWCPLIKKEKK